jgi:ribosome-binding factor A
MENTQFILWLRTLRREDMQAFRQFLEHPQNAAKKLAVAFFDYLDRFQEEWRTPEFVSSPHLTEAAIFAHLYPGEPLKPQRLRRIMMELRQMIEAFGTSITRSFIRPSLDKELRTLLFLLQRNSPLFIERLNSLSTQLAQEELSDDLPLAQMYMEQMRNQYWLHRQATTDSFEQALNHLDEFYLWVKLETWTSMRTREIQFKQSHQYENTEAIDQLVATTGAKGGAMVVLWQHLLALVSKGYSPLLFHAATEALDAVKVRMSKNVLRQVRGYLFNSLMSPGAADHQEHFVRLYDLLDMMLQEGTLHLPDGNIPHTFFLPYVRAACLSGNAHKGYEFIQNHQHSLVSADPAGLVGYCNALVDFSAGNVMQSWRSLLTLKPHDLRTDAHIRILRVQIAFSLAREDDFFRLNDALRKFLGKHPELGERFRTLVKHFFQLAESLAKVKFGRNKASSTLEIRIRREDTAEKLWLLQQYQSLIAANPEVKVL